MITAIVFVKADVARIPEVAEQIAALDGVSEVYSVTGQIDLIALVRVRQHEDVASRRSGQAQQGAGGPGHGDPHRLPHLLPARSRVSVLPWPRLRRGQSGGATRLQPLLVPLLLFVGVFSVYFATAERDGVNVDAYAASAGAWRLATAGTPWFDGLDVTEIEGTHKDKGVNRNGQWISESPNGHVTAQRMPGPILAGVPFYWLFGDSGTSESDFQLGPAALASSFITAAAVVLLFLAMRRHVPTSAGSHGAAGLRVRDADVDDLGQRAVDPPSHPARHRRSRVRRQPRKVVARGRLPGGRHARPAPCRAHRGHARTWRCVVPTRLARRRPRCNPHRRCRWCASPPGTEESTAFGRSAASSTATSPRTRRKVVERRLARIR